MQRFSLTNATNLVDERLDQMNFKFVSEQILNLWDSLQCKSTLDLVDLERSDFAGFQDEESAWVTTQNLCVLYHATDLESRFGTTVRKIIYSHFEDLLEITEFGFIKKLDGIVNVFTQSEHYVLLKQRFIEEAVGIIFGIVPRLWDSDVVRSLYGEYILKEIRKCGCGLDAKTIYNITPFLLKDRGMVEEILDNLMYDGILTSESMHTPSVARTSDNVFGDRYSELDLGSERKNMLYMRFNGATLDVIGKYYGLTRERVRQLNNVTIHAIKEAGLVFEEDVYLPLFLEYELTKKQSELIFGTKIVYNYIHIMYKQELKQNKLVKKLPLYRAGELLSSFCATSYTKRVKQFVDIMNTLNEPELKCLELNEIRSVTMLDVIKIFIFEENKNKLLKASEIHKMYKSCVNNFSEGFLYFMKSSKVKELREVSEKYLDGYRKILPGSLYAGPSLVRYYDFSSYDYKMLFETLRLERYKDVELSAKKLYNENKSVCSIYDINNEGELHRLLRILLSKPEDYQGVPNNLDITFLKLPIIRFGNADRTQQFIDIIKEYRSIRRCNLLREIEERYGFESGGCGTPIFGNLQSYHIGNGIYTVNNN